jgi:predicted dehydrogenase
MNEKKINVGLTGCGHLGSIHCKLLNLISKEKENIIFTGVYDTDDSKSRAIAELYGVKSFASFDELLNNIDTLVVVTPTSTHFQIARLALTKNVNLFIEKPVTAALDEAKELIKLSGSSDIKIQVGHVERFNPALTSLDKYDLKPMFIESHRLSQFNPRGTDVSVIQDLMIHDIDIILHLVGSPIDKIDANGVAIVSEAIDIANARLKFKNGCVANITASRISLKKMRKMRIFQNNAYISIDFLNNKSEVFRLADSNAKADGMTFPISEDKKIIFEQPQIENAENANPIKNELESFFDSIINNKPVKVTLEAGKEAVEVADEIINIITLSKTA